MDIVTLLLLIVIIGVLLGGPRLAPNTNSMLWNVIAVILVVVLVVKLLNLLH